MKIHDKLLLTVDIYKQHPSLDIPVKILKYPVAFDDGYIVHSPITDKTFEVCQGHVRVYNEPEHSEYVVDLPTVNVKPYYRTYINRMTKEEILEGNKLIIEFMQIRGEYDEDQELLYLESDIDNKGVYSFKELKFHSSWNWLMPVCYKISEIIKDKYNIENLTPLDELFNILSGGLYYTNDDLKVSTNILEVYIDVIIFIKWYNIQQK